jgi:hypothetical protein
MLRSILAVVVGYVVMAVVVMIGVAGLTVAFPEYAQAPQTGVVPTIPMVLELVWGFASAIVGGIVVARIARRSPRRHAAVLAAIVLLLGAVYGLTMDLGPLPTWFRVALPPVGAIGVLIGGRIGRR